MDKIRLSFGIVSFNRADCLKRLLDSVGNVDISVTHEFHILDNGSSDARVCSEIMKFNESYKAGEVRTCFLSNNVGFPAAWNILENTMRGEYRVMMQDDTHFTLRKNRQNFKDVLDYMDLHRLPIMTICSDSEYNGHVVRFREQGYTDWPHVEHKSLRRTVGDYVAYPRYFNSLYEQDLSFEQGFARILESANIKVADYHKVIATCQFGKTSLLQTLCHEMPKNLSDAEKADLWDNPSLEKFKKLNMKIWD